MKTVYRISADLIAHGFINATGRDRTSCQIYRQAFDSARVTQFGMLRILHRVKNLRATILTGTLLLLSTHLQLKDDSTGGSGQTILRQIDHGDISSRKRTAYEPR